MLGQLGFSEPAAVYLTYHEKPEERITICWLVPKKEGVEVLKFHQLNDEAWHQVNAHPIALPASIPYTFYRIELEGLKPDQSYEFVLPEHKEPYLFKTLQAELNKPLRFVVGGDVYHDSLDDLKKMNRTAASQNPDFVLLGGDLSYSGSRFSFLSGDDGRWIDFIKSWSSTMKRGDGHLIPLVTAIGNHDVNGKYGQTPHQAHLYYLFFPSGPNGYRVLDFASYLSLWILDTGHTHPIEGAQTAWLKSTLENHPPTLYKFALYHVPAFPSFRSMNNKRSFAVRTAWVPLFEKYGLDVAFENHEHAYKRTHRLKNGRKDPDGVLYLGDGAYGVEKARKPKTPEELWFLAKSAQESHFHLVTLEKDAVHFEAINQEGKVFDRHQF